MPITRIEVRPRAAVSDNRFVDAAHQTGFASLTACSHTRLFFVSADLAEAEAHRLAHELLADPVTETYTLGISATPSGAQLVERTLLPGVTDPVADSLRHAAELVGIRLDAVATGDRFELTGVTSEQAGKIARGVLANTVIHRLSVGEPISAPFVAAQPPDETVETIRVRGLDDAALLALSGERRLSLDLNEMRAIQNYFDEIGREPTDAELEMLAQTWSEHCVHKTFRAKITYTGPAHGAPADSAPVTQEIDGLLKTYIRAATEKLDKPWVRSAFVDNAGIVAFDDRFDVAFKVETHNRPSALEPFGGANTGAGGVIRDVLGVSARPIANTDVLCFGMPDTPPESLPDNVLHPRRIIEGVVHGIEDYGNKMGIPTVNGAVHYHAGYTANPLVFAGCVGILPHGSHRAEAQPDDLIVVIGGRTGRDGLRGATFSSMEMDTTSAQLSGGAVQIGHPINEKQVLEVVLRARDAGLYTAITDCGAGGLSSAVGEMGKELGARVQLADVPLKYPGLQPWEIWLSEAQERMVFAVPPANWEAFREICAAHDVEAVCIGTFAPTGQLSLFYGDRPVGDISMDFLHGGIPRREMKAEWSKGKAESNGQKPETSVPTESLNDSLLALLAHPTIRSKADIVHRYDHEVGSGTAVKPLVGRGAGPGDAAVVVPLDILSVPLTPQPPLPQGARGSLVYGLSETSGPETKKNRAIDGRPQRLAEISERFQKIMLEIARKLRKEHTPSEDMLWQQLRGSKFEGLKFRRQHPIGAFVLDFYCPELMLAIEVDGPIHDDQIEADQLRQEIIEETGIRFLRVSAEEVEYRLAETLEKIRAQIPPRPLRERGLGGEGSEVAIRAIALSVGMCPQYNAHDPYAMAWAAVDEAVRNAVCVGADPDQISILDNFSWGNTQLPDRLGSLVRCAQGCYDAALAYGTPFVSGKDSLNNEYVGQDGQRHSIPGTLVISALGIVPDANQTVTSDFKQAGDLIYLVGTTRPEELGGSAYADLTGESADGVVPQPVPDALATYRALHQAIRSGYVTAAHDPSEGGLAVALAEMCIGGQLGAEVSGLEANAAALFSESAGRIVVTVGPDDAADFEAILGAACTPIGTVGGNALTIGAVVSAKVSELAAAWGGQMPLTPEPPLPLKMALTPNPSPSGRGGQTSDSDNDQGQRKASSDAFALSTAGTSEAVYREMASKAMVYIARDLRQRETSAEDLLWECLRARRLNGLKFRRQHPVEGTNFVADFLCYDARLIVEVDGPIHQQQREFDKERQAVLESAGFTVLRFSNTAVANQTRDILAAIAETADKQIRAIDAVANHTASADAAINPPLPEGEGLGVRAYSRSAKPVLILHAAGSNRDRDAVLACELAGGAPEIVTVNQLVRGERHVQDYAMLVIPGGFSYGDDLGAGVLWALDLRERIPGIEAFVSAGKPVMGICNGFQTLVKSGFLPGSDWDDGRRSITLTYNEGGRFECRWVTLEANPQSACLFTEGITEPIECPIAHGEGRVMVADEATRLRMWKDGLPALTYVGDGYPANPNGSVDAIAGLSNPAGNVFGLMPHPENHLFPWQHPQRVRGFDGLRLFENGVRRA